MNKSRIEKLTPWIIISVLIAWFLLIYFTSPYPASVAPSPVPVPLLY